MKKLNAYIAENYKVRDYKDRRKKVDRYTIEYVNDKGDIYRKSFTFPVNTPFDIVKNNIPTTIQ